VGSVSVTDAVVFDCDGERALYVGPTLREGLPPDVLDGLTRRRLVALGQPCPDPCGARLVVPNRAARRAAVRDGRVLHVSVEHEDDCPALDPRIDQVTKS
jgi:hypothetical protein